MNLQQAIEELEQQARRYTEAANSLRALQSSGSDAGEAVAAIAPAATKQKQKQSASKDSKGTVPKRAAAKKEKTGQKRFVSPETRAKIAAAIKASHAAKKATA